MVNIPLLMKIVNKTIIFSSIKNKMHLSAKPLLLFQAKNSGTYRPADLPDSSQSLAYLQPFVQPLSLLRCEERYIFQQFTVNRFTTFEVYLLNLERYLQDFRAFLIVACKFHMSSFHRMGAYALRSSLIQVLFGLTYKDF